MADGVRPAGRIGNGRGRALSCIGHGHPKRIAAVPVGSRCRDNGGQHCPRERKNPGDDLFSRKAALSVSSALESLTSVFGMGTGVASPLESPGSFASGWFRQRLDASVAMTARGAGMVLRSSSRRRGSDHDPPATDPWSVAEEVKPSTVSTAQLHPSPDFHMRPIKQVVSLRSYPVDPVAPSSRWCC